MVRDTRSTISCGPLMYGSVRRHARAGAVARRLGRGVAAAAQMQLATPDKPPANSGAVEPRGVPSQCCYGQHAVLHNVVRAMWNCASG